MSSRPVIAVVGATGVQGGGLARAILTDTTGEFDVRAITRTPDGPRAKALGQSGAEVVFGDLDDPATLASALRGVHGLFAVTNFWEHFSPEREFRQAGHIAAAARDAGVAHVIWSTLEDTRRTVPLSDPRMPTLMGHYKVPHFDAKGEADALFAGLPTTFLRTSFYWDNLIHFGMGPQRDANGRLQFVLPMGERKLPGIGAADIGPCALALFKRGADAVGQAIGIAGEHLTGAEMAAALGEVIGEPVRHVAMPFADYAALGFPGADDLANMFHFKHDFNEDFCAARPVARTRELHPGLSSFRKWLQRHVQQLPVPAAA
jgi:uncharacterized protein YbjT (DUF2867 family)